MIKSLIAAVLLSASPAIADRADRIVDDAIRHGARGMSRAAMRDMVEMGAHYESRDNSWTNEREYHPAFEYRQEHSNRHWLYFNNEGVIWVDGILMHYIRSRGLMDGGRRAIVNGRTIWEVQLENGRWISAIQDRP
jgi:hypothetical protein